MNVLNACALAALALSAIRCAGDLHGDDAPRDARASRAPTLKASIGFHSVPADEDSVSLSRHASLPNLGGMMREGDTIPDFTLYTAEGEPIRARDQLAAGRPLLLIAASVSCPLFRQHLDSINALARRWDSLLSVIIVYTVEAHPDQGQGPYDDLHIPMLANLEAGVRVTQPATYGERREAARRMVKRLEIVPPVVIDGPENPWWWTFGPAPHNACLVDRRGVVVHKQLWYNEPPDEMPLAVDRLLARHAARNNAFTRIIHEDGRKCIQCDDGARRDVQLSS